jgi:tetratricopeptide (TPR) repeat protein
VATSRSPADTANAAAPRAPYVPADGDAALQEVPARRDPAVRNLAALRAALDAQPRELRAAAALARAYVDFGRSIGDARYAGYAEAVIAPWMALRDPPAAALVLQATIVQFRHRFDEARALLTRALRRDPRDAQAWLVLASIDILQGRFDAARRDCERVARYGGPAAGIPCMASLHSNTGRAREAIVMLRALDVDGAGVAPSYAAWIHGLAAEAHARLGEWLDAERDYRRALAATPGDNYLLVAYADLLLDRGRAREVGALLANAWQSDTAFLRIVLAEAALGSAEATRDTWIMAARFDALALRGDDYYGRENARFALALQRDPQEALALALQNFRVQRAPEDARLVLEAASAAGRPDDAAQALAFVAQARMQDPAIEALAAALRARIDAVHEARR